jgi:hypothetical protein
VRERRISHHLCEDLRPCIQGACIYMNKSSMRGEDGGCDIIWIHSWHAYSTCSVISWQIGGGPLYESFMAGEGLYYTRVVSKLGGGGERTLVGINFCRYRHLRTRDASFLALACPMPSLVGTLYFTWPGDSWHSCILISGGSFIFANEMNHFRYYLMLSTPCLKDFAITKL